MVATIVETKQMDADLELIFDLGYTPDEVHGLLVTHSDLSPEQSDIAIGRYLYSDAT